MASMLFAAKVKGEALVPYVPRPLAEDEGDELLHISCASVPASCPLKDGARVSLMLAIDSGEPVCIATMTIGRQDSIPLDLNVDGYAQFSLVASRGASIGQAEVHVLGYYVPKDFDPEDEDEDGEFDEEPAGFVPDNEMLQQMLARAAMEQRQESSDDEDDDDEEGDSDEDDDDEENENEENMRQGGVTSIKEIAGLEGAMMAEAGEEESDEDEDDDEEGADVMDNDDDEDDDDGGEEGESDDDEEEGDDDADEDEEEEEEESDEDDEQENEEDEDVVTNGNVAKAQQRGAAKQEAVQMPGSKRKATDAPAVAPKRAKKQVFTNGFEVHSVLETANPTAAQARPGKTVIVKYRGMLGNGKVFDETKGNKTFKFRLGTGEVIKGWDRGVAGMRVGDKRKLVVPPEMAYGETGIKGLIPRNATLNFDVELCGVK